MVVLDYGSLTDQLEILGFVVFMKSKSDMIRNYYIG